MSVLQQGELCFALLFSRSSQTDMCIVEFLDIAICITVLLEFRSSQLGFSSWTFRLIFMMQFFHLCIVTCVLIALLFNAFSDFI